MIVFKLGNTRIAGLLLAACAILFGWLGYHNEFCEGGADNYWHYYFSRYSWEYPEFFLHHWGKPFFILLSSGFARLGFYGIQVFNILCAVATGWMCYVFSRDLGFKSPWLSIILLVLTPLYFLAVPSALTEPLFALMFVTVAWLLFRDQFLMAVLLASFLPFSRSEGMFMVMYLGAYLFLLRQYKYIPLLATGFLLYAIIGALSGRGFLWYLTENPYGAISPYGHGMWRDFFLKYRAIWGWPQTLFLLIGSIWLVVVVIRQKIYTSLSHPGREAKLFFLVLVPAGIFFAFHVIVWKFGWCGSAGLERVLVCILPLTTLITFYGLQQCFLLRKSVWLRVTPLLVVLGFAAYEPFQKLGFPLKAYGPDKVEMDAATWFRANCPAQSRVYYAHPAIIFYTDRNPFDKDHNRELNVFPRNCRFETDLPTYIVWDSMFCESSFGVSRADIENCGQFRKVKEIIDGDIFQLCIYERIR